MERFLKRHEGRIRGIISGFDRILFRGTFRTICYSEGVQAWLLSRRIMFKDFATYAQGLSQQIQEHAKKYAERHGRQFLYVKSRSASKEEIARRVIEEEQIREGLVCVLGCVELCKSFRFVRLGRRKDHCGLKVTERPGLHIYFYYLDRDFGLMHVRLQSWVPFSIQVCVNGWEWLARQLDRRGIGYEKRDNCFVEIADIGRAQKLMDSLCERKWGRLLNHFARQINPCYTSQDPESLKSYYWTVRESEYSTDVMFASEVALSSLYPHLLEHAVRHFHSEDVLRFLGRRIDSRFKGEVKSNYKARVEGTRIKHWVEENSIKMYDKQGCVLRVETTVNNCRRWRVWRRTTRRGKRCMAWIPMRKSIADLHRRTEVSRAANGRYLNALAVVGESAAACQVLDPLARRVTLNGRPFRALRPVAPEDAALLSVISRGQFLLQGFRNRHIRRLLHPEAEKDTRKHRQISSRVSRALRLLRAHHIIYRVPKTTLYRISKRGVTVTATVRKLREASLLGMTA